jgi:hypothetical protein
MIAYAICSKKKKKKNEDVYVNQSRSAFINLATISLVHNCSHIFKLVFP